MGVGFRPRCGGSGAAKKLVGAVAWFYGEGQKYCDTCKQAQKQSGITHMCSDCPDRMPDIAADIAPLWDCFLSCDSQLRVSFGGIVAMDWNVVITVALDTGIPTDRKFYRYLKIFESAMIAEMNKKGGSGGGQ